MRRPDSRDLWRGASPGPAGAADGCRVLRHVQPLWLQLPFSSCSASIRQVSRWFRRPGPSARSWVSPGSSGRTAPHSSGAGFGDTSGGTAEKTTREKTIRFPGALVSMSFPGHHRAFTPTTMMGWTLSGGWKISPGRSGGLTILSPRAEPLIPKRILRLSCSSTTLLSRAGRGHP